MENKAIKEMFDKKINKNQIYDKIIQNNHKKKLVILKYAFCSLIILCIINLCFSNNNIYYNKSNISLDNYQIGLTYKNVGVQNNELEKIIKNINISSEYTKVQNEENTIYYNVNDKDKLIVITQIEESNYNSKASKIKNTEVLLYEDGNKLKSIFKVNETTISIETQKLTKQEFIKIIKSIIK